MDFFQKSSLYITNYKCFGDEPVGFDRILPINVIIGKNNSGKSSLIDIVEFAVTKDTQKKWFLETPFQVSEEIIKKTRELPSYVNGEEVQKDLEFFKVGRARYCMGFLEYFHLHSVDGKKPGDDYTGAKLHKIVPKYTENIFRLASERDITPETEPDHNEILFVGRKGNGATQLVEKQINDATFDSSVVEKELLGALNKIFQPETSFTDIVVQNYMDEDGREWEIFLEEEGKGRIALSAMGSGLKTVLLVLINLLIRANKGQTNVFAFEELENNLHPSLQRRLYSYIKDYARDHDALFFLSTHSSIVIDLFFNEDNAQILHVVHENGASAVRPIRGYPDNKNLLEDLGIRASDILQANCVIWVEGPSDRIYMNRWIELLTDGQLQEGIHYQCMFYGGRLLSHLSAEPEAEERIDLLKLNTNSLLLIDSDKKSEQDAVNATKLRIAREIGNSGGTCWILAGREIENYVPENAIAALLGQDFVPPLGPFESFPGYLDSIVDGAGKKFLRDKMDFARSVSPLLEKKDLESVLDFKEHFEAFVDRIRRWNGLGR